MYNLTNIEYERVQYSLYNMNGQLLDNGLFNSDKTVINLDQYDLTMGILHLMHGDQSISYKLIR